MRRLASSALLLAPLLFGCSRAVEHEVTIVDGVTTTHLNVRSAFAEYVELPGQRNELRLTLASYALSCERWVPPAESETALSIVIVTPKDTPPTVGTYAWSGLPVAGEPLTAPYALPKALWKGRSRVFEPGGVVRLTAVQLDPHGVVSGTLSFEFPGEGDRPATRIDGAFEAKVCRLALGAGA